MGLGHHSRGQFPRTELFVAHALASKTAPGGLRAYKGGPGRLGVRPKQAFHGRHRGEADPPEEKARSRSQRAGKRTFFFPSGDVHAMFSIRRPPSRGRVGHEAGMETGLEHKVSARGEKRLAGFQDGKADARLLNSGNEARLRPGGKGKLCPPRARNVLINHDSAPEMEGNGKWKYLEGPFGPPLRTIALRLRLVAHRWRLLEGRWVRLYRSHRSKNRQTWELAGA